MKAVILALALSCAGAFAPVNKAAVRAPVELEAKKSVADLSEADLKGKKVLIRCDLNVPIKEGVIGDDTRIRASVPTVKYLLDKGAKVAMCSHLGRPKDGPEDKFSLGPVAAYFSLQKSAPKFCAFFILRPILASKLPVTIMKTKLIQFVSV